MKNSLVWMAFLFVFLSSGCSNPFQQSLQKEERTRTFVIRHSLDKSTSWHRIDTWIASNYNDSTEVIRLREREEGAFVVRALLPWAFDPLRTTICHSNYLLSIKTKDMKTRLVFELEPTNGLPCRGPFPPKEKMDDIYKEFALIKVGIEDALTMGTHLSEEF